MNKFLLINKKLKKYGLKDTFKLALKRIDKNLSISINLQKIIAPILLGPVINLSKLLLSSGCEKGKWFFYNKNRLSKFDTELADLSRRIKNYINNSKLVDYSSKEEVINALIFLTPSYSSFPLVIVGDGNDGSYILPNCFEEIDSCFSPGTSYKTSFENILSERYEIPCYMCDGSVDKRDLNLNPDFHYFSEKYIGAFSTKNFISLNNWIKSTKFSTSNKILLQIDVEGFEYETLLAYPDELLNRFSVIAIEIHRLEELKSSYFLNTTFLPFIKKLKSKFDVIHVAGTNCAGITAVDDFYYPRVIELTLIRKDLNKQKLYKPQIPHPDDYPTCPDMPNIRLGYPFVNNGITKYA